MDSDGELRLTIMATLAQEESRKKAADFIVKPAAWFAVYSAENGQKTSCLSTAPRKCANAGA